MLKNFVRILLTSLPVFGDRINTEAMKWALSRNGGLTLVPPVALSEFYHSAAREQSERVDGPLTYFEAGVFAGQSMAVWHDVVKALPGSTRSFGADSFEGLPTSVSSDEGGWTPGSFSCPRPVTEWNLERLGVKLDDVRLIEGWFDQTLTPELAQEIGTVHVAMLDADAYSSTVPVLAFLEPLLDDVVWLIFDDWYSGGNYSEADDSTLGTGVERAFMEWLDTNRHWTVEPKGSYDLVRDGVSHRAGYVVRLERSGMN